MPLAFGKITDLESPWPEEGLGRISWIGDCFGLALEPWLSVAGTSAALAGVEVALASIEARLLSVEAGDGNGDANPKGGSGRRSGDIFPTLERSTVATLAVVRAGDGGGSTRIIEVMLARRFFSSSCVFLRLLDCAEERMRWEGSNEARRLASCPFLA